VAWVPDAVPPQGLDIRYRLHMGGDAWANPVGGRVTAVRGMDTGRGRRFLVDFEGRNLGARASDIKAVITVTGGKVVEQHVEHNPFSRGWRASFEVAADPGAIDIELRAFLRNTNEVMTETWSYLWQPKQ
jgi:glucans biosynthesis protein